MEMVGTGQGRTVNILDCITLSGTLKISSDNYTFSSGTLKLNGGLLDVAENTEFNTSIDHLVSSSISVQPQKTLKYAGDGLEIGSLSLTLSGGGIIENTNNLILD